MLSNKWTFSLTSLIVILAFALAAPAMAQFEIKLSVGDADLSYADGNQVAYGSAVIIKIMSTKVVNFEGTATTTTAATTPVPTALAADDFDVIAYNKFGGTVSTGVPVFGPVAVDGTADGMHFMASLGSVTAPAGATLTDGTGITRVILDLKKDKVELADPRVDIGKESRKNKEASIELHFVGAQPDASSDATADDPKVYKIARAGSDLRPVTADNFEVLITLSEEPRKDGFKKDHIDVSNATAGDPTLLDMMMQTAADATPPMLSSGRDMMLYRYIVVITPKYENKNDIVVKVKSFYDQEKMMPNMYMPPATPALYMEGEEKLTVKVGKENLKDKAAGLEVVIPKEKRIPASGYIVFTKSAGDSGVSKPPGSDKDEPKRNERSEAQMLYNVVDLGIPNLETFLANGGTIDLIGAGLYISEIMWGSDASITDSSKSQWIEVANSGTSSILTGDKTHKLIFYGPNETLPDVSTVADRVGTVGAGGFWPLTGKGQSGRTGVGEAPGDVAAVTPTQPLISMQRLMGTDGTPADGTMASSWVQSTPPGLNFDTSKEGVRVGTPGATPVAYPVAPPPEPAPEPAVVVPVAGAGDIKITEIMVDMGETGRLPQWIELTNVSGAAKRLAGWSLMVTNSGADADVVGTSVSIDLSGNTLGVGGGTDMGGTLGKSLLLVAFEGRSSSNLDGNERIVDVSSEVGQRGRYKLISDMAFMIALVPPQMTGVLTYGDTAGNLDAATAWDLPMSENGRSSLIRREMEAGMATMGTDANGWVLASGTSLAEGPATWYGSDEDSGTPGHDAGGPLPVELSQFRPARDKTTGAVVITWSTQSELNNAGFFIKRSQQRDGEFQVINATMVPGAGTTSEKQFYTYTDSTAQPNVVYYYQIEDVSLDGNRQTLTRGIRLKGHIGAAGKATTTWGDLKTQE
jgi:hypothetical protein